MIVWKLELELDSLDKKFSIPNIIDGDYLPSFKDQPEGSFSPRSFPLFLSLKPSLIHF